MVRMARPGLIPIRRTVCAKFDELQFWSPLRYRDVLYIFEKFQSFSKWSKLIKAIALIWIPKKPSSRYQVSLHTEEIVQLCILLAVYAISCHIYAMIILPNTESWALALPLVPTTFFAKHWYFASSSSFTLVITREPSTSIDILFREQRKKWEY